VTRCVANKTGWRTPRTIFFVTNAKRTQEGVISISLVYKDDLCLAMDCVLERQRAIERKLAGRRSRP
jgi:hypothetical protein